MVIVNWPWNLSKCTLGQSPALHNAEFNTFCHGRVCFTTGPRRGTAVFCKKNQTNEPLFGLVAATNMKTIKKTVTTIVSMTDDLTMNKEDRGLKYTHTGRDQGKWERMGK